MLNSQEIARMGELIAQKFLEKKGFRLCARNFFIRGGEIDLVMEDNDIMIFVEVKTRTSRKFGSGEEAINYHKKRKLIRAIFHYLKKNQIHKQWRADLISIDFLPASAHTKAKAKIKHIPHIFLQ